MPAENENDISLLKFKISQLENDNMELERDKNLMNMTIVKQRDQIQQLIDILENISSKGE
jgi:hypothetical protein